MSSQSDSDSDFGEFGEAEEVEVQSQERPQEDSAVTVLLDCMRKVLNAKQEGVEVRDKEELFADLLRNGKTKMVHDRLFPHGQPLPADQWNSLHIRKIIAETQHIKYPDVAFEPEEDDHQPESEEQKEDEHFDAQTAADLKDYVIQDELFRKLEQAGFPVRSLTEFGYTKRHGQQGEAQPRDVTDLLRVHDFEALSENELAQLHDELIDVVHFVLEENDSLRKEEQELLKDKAMYEELLTNLVGHTQRLRRQAIAEQQKKQKKKYKR